MAPVVPARGRWRPLGLDDVTVTGGLFGRLAQRNHDVSLAHVEHWAEREGWLANFDAAARGELGRSVPHRGRVFSDSDVFKLLEGLAWEYGRTGDPAVDARFVALAERVLAAQQPDGYLGTSFGWPGQPARWSDLEWGHELYCVGHLVQAGVARARTVGEDDVVRAVRRAADHVCEVFSDDGLVAIDGHPEIEPALVELFRVTGDRRYLDQARRFVERRGRRSLAETELGPAYFSDDTPVRSATVLRGHAVRALYLTAGAVDLAVEDDDPDLLGVLADQWDVTVQRRTHLTGGMGSRHTDEGFGADFELPPDRSYSETCAGVGSVMVSWRLLLATGDARQADLIERTLYNVLAASPSADGTHFFYANTLHRREPGEPPAEDRPSERADSSMRAPWFTTSCCPTNLARTFASLPAYVATADDGGLQLHQHVPVRVVTSLPGGRPVALRVRTDYPTDGRVLVEIESAPVGPWTLSLRVPGWAVGAELVTSGAVRSVEPGAYADVTRDFAVGDTVELRLPVAPRLTRADPRVDAVRGCLAVERGPEVLCLESVDLPDGVVLDDVRLDATQPLVDRGGEVTAALSVDDSDRPPAAWPYGPPNDDAGEPVPPTAVALRPYRTWANRGPSTMRVWLPVG